MKLQKILAILPLAFTSMVSNAEEKVTMTNSMPTQFSFSTEVSRTVEKDLMRAMVYSQKVGKSLPELKAAVSANLNKVIADAKPYMGIKIQTEGVSSYPNYNHKNKVDGWVVEGRVLFESKDFAAMAKVLDNLGEEVAIGHISFSVSPEKMAALEDEMTLDIIKQFQHKAEVVQKGLNAKRYTLSQVQLETPNGEGMHQRPMMAMAKSSYAAEESSLPLEAGSETISARASGTVTFE
ncbi:SIMPL domain-containing protein [Actinobacillus equuli]|uniref:SIMPL domain-containing protein n=1 Tax=Actinobacillus equuli TaxID=718 RepID=UPI002442047E|nr:SIMPL domain-containing protein [Actinobacillus equuli]WGE46461.1 SIMPL domain-containing protein [Actinobacillus equuli subsp. haemolyticus]WGE50652.1 SIMPL domain-containing protein [Actinobacillus equuli subsp. haemolyticus]